jgi:hypothetical protein
VKEMIVVHVLIIVLVAVVLHKVVVALVDPVQAVSDQVDTIDTSIYT